MGYAVADLIESNLIRAFGWILTPKARKSEKTSDELRATLSEYSRNALQNASRCKFFGSSEPIELFSFYISPDIEHSGTQIADAQWQDLRGISNRLILTGIAGTGKSTAFRAFFIQELKDGRFPVMINLRELPRSNGSLIQLIVDTINNNVGGIDEAFVREAATRGAISFFFDGLDEVPQDLSELTSIDIQDLATHYPSTYIVVSSRPFDHFQSWSDFTVCKILPLRVEQACALIARVPSVDSEIRSEFQHQLKERLFDSHSTFAQNPLLLTLMLLIFQNSSEIPTKWHLFYEEAYLVLFSHHDARKQGGFKRLSRTKLDRDEFGRAFSIFSALTFLKHEVSFEESALRAAIEVTITAACIDCTVDDFIYDCETNVCLLIREGTEIRFIHRSFQEHFAATYVAKYLSHEEVEGFFNIVQGSSFVSPTFLQSLYGMNRMLYLERLFIPLASKLLALLGAGQGFKPATYAKFIKHLDLSITILNQPLGDGDDSVRSISYNVPSFLQDLGSAHVLAFFAFPNHDSFYIWPIGDELARRMVSLSHNKKDDHGRYVIRLADVLKVSRSDPIHEQIRAWLRIESTVNSLRMCLRSAEELVNRSRRVSEIILSTGVIKKAP